MTHVRVLGIDLAKQIFHVVGMDDTGTVVLRKCLPRSSLMPFIGICQLSLTLAFGSTSCRLRPLRGG